MSPHFIHRIVSTLSHFLVQPFLCSLSLYSTSLPPSLTKPRSKHHAMPHEPNPHSQIVVHQHSHTNPTHHIHSNPWLDHHATPCHAAELAMPSTMSSKPPTIGFLLISLQWWVLLLGLFDLGCGFVSLDAGFFYLVVFFVMSISLVVFDVGFAFGFVSFTVPFFFLRCHWWIWVYVNGDWSVLLWQWLLVTIVAAVVDVSLLLLTLLIVMIRRR